ncbi:MAG: hypothetical protein ACR2KX_07825 [Chitinophagaceae bacterium]
MKKFFLCLLLFVYALCYSHPGIGVVRDSKGNIYYTDLVNVWKLAPDGKKSIAVHNVHTHELYVDTKDDLYGEHLWYNGEKLNTWGHYVWCLRSNNKLDTIIKPTAGFLKNYSFVRDKNENMYWVVRDSMSTFKKRSPDGNITTLLQRKFADIRWMYATKGGNIYFVDLVDLYKINVSGKLILVAKNISGNSPAFGMYSGKHSLMGIWTDGAENVYVANLSGQVVKRISQTGKVENFAYSTTPWSPTGGVLDNDGNLWLLETSLTNDARVRKIIPSKFIKGKTTPMIISNYILPVSIITIIVLAIIAIIRFLLRKKKKDLISLG